MIITNCLSGGSRWKRSVPQRCLLIKPTAFFQICIFLLLLISALTVKSQNVQVSGRVTGEDSSGLAGVTVSIKGNRSKAVVTDANGNFSISVPTGKETLVFTYVGFTDQEVSVDNRTNLNVSMTVASKSLNDVVVVGYGTVKRKDVTGAVAGINQHDIKSRPVADALQAMQGKVAGVDITSAERPGTLGNIYIRGVRSLTASNQPLFVVDGIPLTSGGIEYINPLDIESIDVLKDASATAIYGSRGANGARSPRSERVNHEERETPEESCCAGSGVATPRRAPRVTPPVVAAAHLHAYDRTPRACAAAPALRDITAALRPAGATGAQSVRTHDGRVVPPIDGDQRKHYGADRPAGCGRSSSCW